MESILHVIQSGLSWIVPFVILLGILIFVHELGHFMVAKFFGVRVEVFSLGFGKKIFTKVKGDTTYAISLIPLGGYVKMFGDEPGSTPTEDQKKYSFTHKPVLQRIGVVLAGPVMNFLFAIVLFFVIAVIGEQHRAPKAGDILPSTAAYQAGFRSGDTILSVGSEVVDSWDDFQHLISSEHGKSLDITVQRDASALKDTVKAMPIMSPNPNILSMDEFVGEIQGLSSNAVAPVLGVRDRTKAAAAGLKTGDIVKSINGVEVKYYRQIENLLIANSGSIAKLVVSRSETPAMEKSQDVTVELDTRGLSSLGSIGIEPSDLYLWEVIKETPAEKAGLRGGDRILSVNGATPSQWEDVLATVKSFTGNGAVKIQVERAGEGVKEFEMIPQMTSHLTQQGSEEKRFTIGVRPWIMYAPTEIVEKRYLNPITAVGRGFERTIEATVMTAVSFLRLVQGMISPKTIGGVISIGQVAKESFQLGIVQFLTIMAFISINLFVLNLLPIPVLDGGHLLFYSIEAIKGAPVSMRKMEIAQQIGLVLLMSLMAFSLFNDFTRILSN